MSTNVVTVESVEKTYGKRNENQSKALRGVSLNIKEGNSSGLWVLLGLEKRLYLM